MLDAGTGIRALGLDLVRRGVRRINLFLTHLHLDHLEGLRFFAPLWDPDVTVEIWGPRSPVLSLRERILRGFSPPLFPIDFRDVPARITFHDLPARAVADRRRLALLGPRAASGPDRRLPARVRRLERRLPPGSRAGARRIEGRSPDWLSGGALAAGADVLLHDSQYLDDEYGAKIGWGHSSVDDAVAYSARGRRATGSCSSTTSPSAPTTGSSCCRTARASSSGADGPAPELAREGMVIDA